MSVPLASTHGFSLRRRMLLALSCSLALLCGASTRGAAEAQTVLTNCTEGTLRDALAAGGRVSFGCSGTLTLGGTILITTNVALDATGFQVTVSGAAMVRLFQVQSNVTFTVNGVTISHGRERDGGGLLNQGGMINLVNTVLLSNSAYCSGGGVLNEGGTVNATNCLFRNNGAGGGACPAQGAAISSLGGTVNLDHCIFEGNTATGVTGSPGMCSQAGSGGAVYNLDTLNVSACTFVSNVATGGRGPDPWGIYWGGPGGDGTGGGICNAGVLQVQSSTFASNRVAGGAGAFGGQGAGGIYPDGTIGQPGNPGGEGGSGNGGALFNGGTACLTNCTLAWNTAAGANGGAGGNGTPTSGAYYGPGGAGGNGGSGGSGFGGICSPGGLDLVNCTCAYNSATNGTGGPGGAGGAGHGAPAGPSGAPGGNGIAIGGMSGRMVNDLLAGNVPVNSGGGTGHHNLSTDPSCPGASWGPDLMLMPLVNNGGPTLTMALGPLSPAIDAGDTAAAPATDQRGVPRPFGYSADVGAFEYWPPAPALQIIRSTNGIALVASGVPGESCRLFTSTNFATWTIVATNHFGADATVRFQAASTARLATFYRLALP